MRLRSAKFKDGSGFSKPPLRISAKPWHTPWLQILILFALGFSIYGGALNNGFVLDDEDHIVYNSTVHQIGSFRDFFSGSTVNAAGSGKLRGIYYKPLMTLSYSVLWTLFGQNPLPFHLYQLILHILNSVLLLLFLRRILPSRDGLNVGAAALFLLHPLNTEAVVYIACLQDVLYFFFGVIALTALANPGRSNWKKESLIATALLASLLSKETGVLFFVITLVYAGLFKRETLRRLLIFETAAFAVYLWLRLGVAQLNTAHESVTQIGQASFSIRFMTSPLALAMYLWQFVAPIHLTITQDWIVGSLSLQSFLLPLLTLAAAFGACLWYLKRTRDRVFLFFFLWALAGLALHSQILVPLDGTFADRWFYFPGAGLIGMLATVLTKELRPTRAKAALAIIIIGIFAGRSFNRSLDWKDAYTLYSHDIELMPESYDLQNNFGVELFRRGQVSEAKTHFEISTGLAPHWTVNWNNLGTVHWRAGDLKAAENDYRRSIENGTYYMAFENYAGLLLKEDRSEDARNFLEQRALLLFPGNPVLLEDLKIAKSAH